MTLTIHATYENGALRPKEPLPLDEGAEVELIVMTPLPEDDPLDGVIGIGESGRTDGAMDDDHDLLDEVIGICKEGPDVSLAAHHDDLLRFHG
jgi:predicted DNA-binding antitoxin AbrB/MazE fold protein